jgi:replicative DNA helicase
MNIEESALISCLLASPERVCLVEGKIKPEYFEDTSIRNIYTAIIELEKKDLVSIAKFTNHPLANLMELANTFPKVDDQKVNTYGFGVLAQWKKRRRQELILSGDTENLADKLKEIDNITFFDDTTINASEVFLKNAEDRYTGKEDLRNIKTYFYPVDEKIKGFRKSELIIIGGRPGSGKTTLGMNVAYRMAKQGKKVLFCSLEMSEVELHERIVKSITGIYDFENMDSTQWEELINTSKELYNSTPLMIYDKAGMTIEDVFRKTYQKKPDIVFVDHLSILRTTKNFAGNRYAEVSYLTGQLKILAREMDIPVVCLCQLNRQVEGRTIKAPNLSDLRDSGSIEQDADIVSFIYRPEYHLRLNEPDDGTKEHTEWQVELEKVKGKGYWIIAKNRRGYLGRFELKFDGKTYSFN